MPVVPVVQAAWGPTRSDVMGVKVEGEPVVTMVTTPPQMRATPGVWVISESNRPGRQAVTQATNPGLRTLSFDHWVRDPNPWGNIENLLHPLRGLAEKGKRLEFVGNCGMLAAGTWWWLESLDIEEEEKGRLGVVSRARLTWSLKEANRVSAVRLTRTGVKKGTVTYGGVVPAR